LNGSDSDGDSLSFRITTPPKKGALAGATHPDEGPTKQMLCYQQDPVKFNFVVINGNIDTFAFVAVDSHGAPSKPASARITVSLH